MKTQKANAPSRATALWADWRRLGLQMSETGQPYCYNTCGSCVAPTPVTFQVDMSTQAEVSVNGVCVAGSFQGWTPA